MLGTDLVSSEGTFLTAEPSFQSLHTQRFRIVNIKTIAKTPPPEFQ